MMMMHDDDAWWRSHVSHKVLFLPHTVNKQPAYIPSYDDQPGHIFSVLDHQIWLWFHAILLPPSFFFFFVSPPMLSLDGAWPVCVFEIVDQSGRAIVWWLVWIWSMQARSSKHSEFALLVLLFFSIRPTIRSDFLLCLMMYLIHSKTSTIILLHERSKWNQIFLFFSRIAPVELSIQSLSN